MIATLEPPSPLDQWRQHLGGRRRRAQPRPLAAMGYMANGPVIDGLIAIEKLTVILLYDEPIRPGHCALRLAGYSGSRVPWGVRFGGPENCRFCKDLRLQPVPGGRGYRLDFANAELLVLGLQLERELDRCTRHRQRPVREEVCLPKFWAGFRPAEVADITGDGPELAAYAAHRQIAPAAAGTPARDHLGIAIFPGCWVSHHWQQAVAVFADLERFPKRQVFRLRQPSDDLIGYQDAVEFDFHSRFRHASSGRRRRHAGHPAAAMATP